MYRECTYSISGVIEGISAPARPSICSAMSSGETPSRISGSWMKRWKSRTSASAIRRSDCA